MPDNNMSEKTLLKLLKSAIGGQTTDKSDDIQSYNKSDLFELLRIADQHHILPIIFNEISKVFQPCDENAAWFIYGKKRSSQIILRQAQKTADFMLLYEYLVDKGLHPMIVKGIVCRELYQEPEYRDSIDEDLLVKSGDIEQYHDALISFGLTPARKDYNFQKDSEIAYVNEDTHLYIEIHKSLFETDSDFCRNLNVSFENAFDRGLFQSIYGRSFYTLDYSDHLLFLILHAFKHFIYSGIGIRSVCDIGLFTKKHIERINWDYIQKELERVNAFYYAKGLFCILQSYLLPEIGQLVPWNIDTISVDTLIQDIMESGVHGNSSLVRLHSSNVTLHAVRSNKEYRPGNTIGIVFHSVFLPMSSMTNRYSYLKRFPFLLPVAWIQRSMGYLIKNKGTNNKESSESIRLGKERVKLLHQYYIL